MTNKVRWGVIGSGGIASRRTIPEGIVPAQNSELVAVLSRDTEANAILARTHGVKAVNGLNELLECDVDAIYIGTPPGLHCDQTLACAQAGKHILCEKPLGLTVAEAQRMITACAAAKVRLGTAFMMRFIAQHQAALDLIRQGRLGRPVFARAQLSCWYPPLAGAWRQSLATGGGGSLMDMGGHCVDLLEMMFGLVRTVNCITRRIIHDYESEDGAVASLQFDNGALGVVDTFFCVPDEASQNRLELYGSMGSILAKGTIGQGSQGEMTAFLKEREAGYDALQTRSADGGISIQPAPVNPYRAEIEEFSRAILEHREPANNAMIGLQSQRVLAACYESARTGKVVDIHYPKPSTP